MSVIISGMYVPERCSDCYLSVGYGCEIKGLSEMLVKNVIIITQKIKSVSRRSVQLVDVIRMLIGLTDIFVNHIKAESEVEE